MNTYGLNEFHDMYVMNGQIARKSNSDAILQTIKTRLLTVQEEWFLDLSAGLPWFTKMAGKNADLYTVRNYLTREITASPGVDSLISLNLQYNSEARKLDIEFAYTDIYGRTMQGAM